MKLFRNDVDLESKGEMESYLLAYDHRSAAQCFSGLYMWRNVHDFCWEDIEGYLCVEGHYRPRQDEDRLVHYMFPPIPRSGKLDPEELKKVISKAQIIFAEAGEEFMIKRLPGNMKPAFEQAFPDAEIIEDRTYFDYVYNLSDLIELRGKRYHGKKNHLNGFNKTYEHEIKSYDSSMKDEVLDLVDRINASRDDSPEDAAALRYERETMVDVLENTEKLNMPGVGIYIGGRMEAFALGGKVSDEMITEHIEKANIEFRGAYGAINHAFCVMAAEAGYTLVNREEDMGSENLRKSKLSYHPIELVDKYEVKF